MSMVLVPRLQYTVWRRSMCAHSCVGVTTAQVVTPLLSMNSQGGAYCRKGPRLRFFRLRNMTEYCRTITIF